MLMTGLALLLFCTTFMYLNFRPDVSFLLTKQNVVHHPVWRTVFYVHILSGMLAIVLGPFQFIACIRKHYPKAHRQMGKIYVMAILATGSPSGLYMAFFANGGAAASLGFVLMSILWFYTTWMAISTIRKHQIDQHQRWMVRSYAITFSAVSLRLWVPLLSLFTQMEHLFIIILTAWISWLINLAVAEALLFKWAKVLRLFKSQTI